jgi:hypothetical protein
MEKSLPLKLDRETLRKLTPEQLVNLIIEQAVSPKASATASLQRN